MIDRCKYLVKKYPKTNPKTCAIMLISGSKNIIARFKIENAQIQNHFIKSFLIRISRFLRRKNALPVSIALIPEKPTALSYFSLN